MNKFALKIVIKLLTINEDQEDQEFFKVRKSNSSFYIV